MDLKTYLNGAKSRLPQDGTQASVVEHAQVQILLAHFARHAPDVATFVRELETLARSAERDGRLTLGRAAREILADWEAGRADSI